jgi:Holliday junction resolvase RusA-like endonuclease
MNAQPVTIVLDGAPIPKARARFGRGHAYTPQSTVDYQHALGWRAKAGMGGRKPIIGPVAIAALFELPVPAAWPKARRAAAITGDICPTGKPDLDNFVKAALDAINGIVICDDAQITTISARKVYGLDPKIVLTVTPLNDGARP